MGQAAFFADDAKKKRAAAAVEVAEAQTSAEIVVAVRRVSGHYRATDYLLGFIAMGLVVLYMLLAPQVFSLGQMALEGMAGFVVGALSSAYLPPYAACRCATGTWRPTSSERRGRPSTSWASRAPAGATASSCCVGLRAPLRGRARHRYRRVDLGANYQDACRAIRAAARARSRGLRGGRGEARPALASAMPRREDDVNELPDEVQ